MKEIKLTQNKTALVDNSDFEELNKFKWMAEKSGDKFYANRHYKKEEGKKGKVRMHVFIMKTPKGMDTDHKDNNGLNNQRKNLRVCTHSENLLNSGKQKNNTSGFKGVYWCKREGKWLAQIRINKKQTYLGQFNSKLEAFEEFSKACIKHHGEFSKF